MSETKIYPPPQGFAARALVNASAYASMYRESVTNPEAFWAQQARERLAWSKPFTQVKDTSFDANDLHVRWFADGELNVSVNCLDRHLAKRPEQTAILWEPDDPNGETRLVSYRELHESVCKLSNALKRLGVTGKAVLIDVTLDDKLAKSVRNIPGVAMVPSSRVTARDVMNAGRVVVTRGDATLTLSGHLRRR